MICMCICISVYTYMHMSHVYIYIFLYIFVIAYVYERRFFFFGWRPLVLRRGLVLGRPVLVLHMGHPWLLVFDTKASVYAPTRKILRRPPKGRRKMTHVTKMKRGGIEGLQIIYGTRSVLVRYSFFSMRISGLIHNI